MIKVANAPCSWGVLEFDLEGEAADYAQVLDEMRETGYDGTELGDWGFMPTDPEALATELGRRQLTMLGAFVPVALANPDDHQRGIEAAVRTARLLSVVGGQQSAVGGPYIVLADDNATDPVRTQNAGRVTPEMGLTAEQWGVYTAGAEEVARAVCDATGLRTVFHHHCAGFVETPDEVQAFLDLTDPALIGLCFDTGHYRFGGGDPVAGLRQHADRIWHVHFKDCQPEVAARSRAEHWDYLTSLQHGVFCELGNGEVNFPAVLTALREMDYQGWIVVEQDVLPGMGRPKESACRNRLYLSGIGL
jgi:inosose dehydratase